MSHTPNVIEVRIPNSENNTYYYFSAREDRLRVFYQFILKDRRELPMEMPGMSYAASFGVTAIFCRIPPKFPLQDILVWLRKSWVEYLEERPNPVISIPEVENALERFALTVTQLYQDGSGDEVRTELV
jgi:hypothetical protein